MSQEHVLEIDSEAWIVGEIEVLEDTIGDPQVVNGTQKIYTIELRDVKVMIGIGPDELDITPFLKQNPKLWQNIKDNYIEDFKGREWKR